MRMLPKPPLAMFSFRRLLPPLAPLLTRLPTSVLAERQNATVFAPLQTALGAEAWAKCQELLDIGTSMKEEAPETGDVYAPSPATSDDEDEDDDDDDDDDEEE